MTRNDSSTTMSRGRERVALGSVLVLVVLACWSCRPQPTLLVSDPPGATVWQGEDIVGRTPVAVPRTVAGPVQFRVALPGCEDVMVAYDPGADYPGNELLVTLRGQTEQSLRCESAPSGADVYVQGEFRGRTPLQLRHLEAGTVEVVFMMASRKTVTRSVDVASVPDGTLRVDLPSMTEEYYRQRIEREPRNIHHYADLAHHYMLEGRLDDAMMVFVDAVNQLIKTPGIGDASRLWSEIQRVTDEQYEFGDQDQVRRAREALRDTLGKLLEQHPNAPLPDLHVNYVLVLKRLGERQRAQKAFERAWRRFPGDRTLQRLRREGFAVP